MKFEARHERNIAILTGDGRLMIGVGDVALRNAVAEALNSGAQNVLIDLGAVTMIDSSGVAGLTQAMNKVSNLGGKLKLCNLSARVKEVLEMSQRLPLFEVYSDEAAGLRSF